MSGNVTPVGKAPLSSALFSDDIVIKTSNFFDNVIRLRSCILIPIRVKNFCHILRPVNYNQSLAALK